MAAAIVKAWTGELSRSVDDTEEGASRLRGLFTDVCDAAMPRIRGLPPRRQVYWWTPELADLREQANLARRQYTRCRRRREGETMAAPLREAWKEKKASLQRAIRKAKAVAWESLCETIDKDSWGRPYKIVRKKLAARGSPLIETLPPRAWTQLCPLSSLLVRKRWTVQGDPRTRNELPGPWKIWGSLGENFAGFAGGSGLKTAPGSDGISAKVLALAEEVLREGLQGLYNRCLETGRFPSLWKVGRVVLL
jgi:hypothetical protein